MVLVVDIGNTNITCGVFEGDDILTTFRLTTKLQRTSDEYGVFICELLRTQGIDKGQIEAVLISSVVPNIMYSFQNGIVKYLNKKPLVIGAGTKTGINIHTANPKEDNLRRRDKFQWQKLCFRWTHFPDPSEGYRQSWWEVG